MNWKITAALIAALLGTMGGAAFAEPVAAKDLLQSAMQKTTQLTALSFDLDITTVIVKGPEEKEQKLAGTMVLRGTSDLYFSLKNERQELQIYSNGTDSYFYQPDSKEYMKLDGTPARSRLIAGVSAGFVSYPLSWLSDYLHNGEQMITGATDFSTVPEREIGGAKCDGGMVAYPAFDVVAWISAGEPPVLRQMEMDLSRGVKESGEAHGGMDGLRITMDFANWKGNAPAPDDRFKFTPPEGAVEAKDPEEEGTLKEGAAAPDFTLPLLGGGEAKLSAHKGKDVVVLDFWATWCGPCRKAMPIVVKVTDELAAKGVVLYAVNQREEPEQIKTFLEGAGIKAKVALDSGEVGETYGANSIPLMYVVGRDGLIKNVHRGLSPDLESELRAELEQALAEAPAAAQ